MSPATPRMAFCGTTRSRCHVSNASRLSLSMDSAVAETMAAGCCPYTARLKRSLSRKFAAVRCWRSWMRWRCLSFSNSSAGKLGLSKISVAKPNQSSKLSLRPEAFSTRSGEPNDAPASIAAPKRSTASAICKLVLVLVPSRSICAVVLANPVKSAGSNKAPAPLT